MSVEFIISGRILPEIREISIPNIDPLRVKEPNGHSANIKFSIKRGVILANGKSEIASAPLMHFSAMRTEEYLTSIVNLVAFSKGWALSVIIDECRTGGKTFPIVTEISKLGELSTSFKTKEEFLAVLEILLPNFELRLALNDLITSLDTLNYSAIASARAIEVIRNQFQINCSNEKEAWQMMRERLNVSRDYLQFITDLSIEPRHGKRGGETTPNQLETSKRAWVIFDRYLHYSLAGKSISLNIEKFPRL